MVYLYDKLTKPLYNQRNNDLKMHLKTNLMSYINIEKIHK